ncbi:hypothetical protein [Streptomyces sp. SID1034]|uniref:hypothetical protein n=1 Tax=Streptomyces sp. SID1034 TaxID=2690248 RepID=UPI001367D899|nr:hypothetical protein [Streptomyces sp. SID1034]MYV92247.1 hypothetical protein [Streptomyces sp. SID1034]
MRPGSTGLRGLRALAALALLPVGLFAAGCGIQSTDVVAVGDPATAQAMPPAQGATVLYFVGADGLLPVVRPGTPRPVLPLLFGGPDEDERAAGLRSELPPLRGALKMAVEEGGVTVVLGQDVSGLTPLAQRQIACTALQMAARGPRLKATILGNGFPSSLSPLACSP